MPTQIAPPVKLFLFFALSPEAKPFIVHFGFKKIVELHVFEIYQAQDMILTITGIGKSAMAAGVAYSVALFGDEHLPVMVNIGIAGHQHALLGQLWMVEKVTDADSAKRYYPQCLPKTACCSAPLVTVSQPQTCYAPDTLYDMEASAFYETAIRFTSSELVLMMKVISDNEDAAIHTINAKQVSLWLAEHVDTVAALLKLLTKRAQTLIPPKADTLELLTKVLHFTVSEKNQLKILLLRWQVLTDNTEMPLSATEFSSARLFLSELSARIQQLPVSL
ncbi:MAG: hypothetical protein NTV00_17305 [Methylococcales bacterium]|nr:hypothetical protein [Methylococcales bacterium]